MCELKTFYQLLSALSYGKNSAQTAEQLFHKFSNKSLPDFKRKLRVVAQDARLAGHWVIGDNSGYYLAVSKSEWQEYRNRRMAAINSELQAIASCDKISLSDLIKNVYAVSTDDNNYTFF
jgi:ABC-type ATPase involved in cell division